MSYDPSKWYSYSKNRPKVPDDDVAGKKLKLDYIKTLESQNQKPAEDVVTEVATDNKEDISVELKPEIENPVAASSLASTDQLPGIDTEQLQSRKCNDFVKRLQKMTRELPSAYKKRITYDLLTQLAQSLIDDTVFEIVKGLEDIQQISEKNLLTKRMAILTEHKAQRVEMTKRHHAALQECKSRPHQVKVVEREHKEEKKTMEEKLDRELNQLEQKLVLEIDQHVIDQQATLQRAGVPLFSITNNPDDVRLQMYLLDFITRLIPSDL